MFVNHDVVSCSILNGPGVNKNLLKTCSFKNGTKNEDMLVDEKWSQTMKDGFSSHFDCFQ